MLENRRRSTRVPIQTDVTCEMGSRTVRRVTWNPSQGGIQVEAGDLRPGVAVRLSFRGWCSRTRTAIPTTCLRCSPADRSRKTDFFVFSQPKAFFHLTMRRRSSLEEIPRQPDAINRLGKPDRKWTYASQTQSRKETLYGSVLQKARCECNQSSAGDQGSPRGCRCQSDIELNQQFKDKKQGVSPPNPRCISSDANSLVLADSEGLTCRSASTLPDVAHV